MKSKMARTSAGRDGGKRRIVRDERSFLRIEAIDQHFVEPEIGRISEAVSRIQIRD